MDPRTLSFLETHSGWIVFFVSLVVIYLLLPAPFFTGYTLFLTVLFMVIFSFSMTCVARNLLDNIRTVRSRTRNLTHNRNRSIISMLYSVAGPSAFNTCGALACSYGVSLFLLSTFFPAFFLELLSEYSSLIITVFIVLQSGALYQMKRRPHLRKILHLN